MFYDKLKFIYIELPKFTKTVEQLESQLDKWLFLLRHLAELENPPSVLQSGIFQQLLEVAEIANFSLNERDSYENSLKYYRDLNNVIDTSREEGRIEGREEEKLLNLQRQRAFVIRQLARKLGEIPETVKASINQLSLESLEALSEELFDFSSSNDLVAWLEQEQV